MSSNVVHVDFHGDSIQTVEHEGAVYVALKPIAERFGLDWPSQWRRLQRDTILAEGIVVTTIPSAGGAQQTVLLPLDLLNGWLFGIDDKRVKAEIRQRLLLYKKECYRVLHQRFFGQIGVLPFDVRTPSGVRAAGRAVAWARRIYGQDYAELLWSQIGLPTLVDPPAKEPAKEASSGDGKRA